MAPGARASVARRVTVGIGLCVVLAGCGAAQDHSTEMPVGVSDPALVERVPFGDVTTDHCIAGTSSEDGLVAVAACDVPGSVPVQQVTTVGAGAPEARPAEQVVHGYASASCSGAVVDYARERDIPQTGLLQIAVISGTQWSGAQTPVVCAVSEAM